MNFTSLSPRDFQIVCLYKAQILPVNKSTNLNFALQFHTHHHRHIICSRLHYILNTMSSVSLSDFSSSEGFQPLDVESEYSEVQASEALDTNSPAHSAGSASPNLISITPSTSSSAVVPTTPCISHKGRRLTSPIHSHGMISESGGIKYWKCSYCKSASN